MTTNSNSIEKDSSRLTTKAKIYIVRGMIATTLFAAYFFLISGRWNYERAWIYYILGFVIVLSSNPYLVRTNPMLLDHRSKIQKGTKKWDKIWLAFFGIFFLHGINIIAGLDLRSNEPQFNSVWLIGLGAFLYITFSSITTWAMSVNKHFETSVRIQDDKDHRVISEGPYKYVRHPGYTGIFGWVIGYAFMVGSSWALYAGLVMIIGLFLRTYLEDRTLQNELNGYKEYTERVRYRLIPGVW